MVEQSVKFNFKEEELTEGAPLKGEWDILEDDEQSSFHTLKLPLKKLLMQMHQTRHTITLAIMRTL